MLTAAARPYLLWGGYEGAERRVVVLLPEPLEQVEPSLAGIGLLRADKMCIRDSHIAAEPHKLHGMLPVEMLHAGLEVDIQVLGCVAVVHVLRHVKIHPAKLVDNNLEGLKVHQRVIVHGLSLIHI